MEKRLTKSDNKLIAGVCAGVAEYFGWDPTWVRIAYAFMMIFSAAFPGLLLYIALCFIMPKKEEV